MFEILSRLFTKNEHVCLYINDDDSTAFVYGDIIAIDETWVAVNLISPEGFYDGILVVKTSQIIRVEVNSKYSVKMMLIRELKHTTLPDIKLDKEDILLSVLELSKSFHKIVSFETIEGETSVTGFVYDIGEESCSIHLIDDYGREDGMIEIVLRKISKISFDSCDEARLLRLYSQFDAL